jgi:hypothetical protein
MATAEQIDSHSAISLDRITGDLDGFSALLASVSHHSRKA